MTSSESREPGEADGGQWLRQHDPGDAVDACDDIHELRTAALGFFSCGVAEI